MEAMNGSNADMNGSNYIKHYTAVIKTKLTEIPQRSNLSLSIFVVTFSFALNVNLITFLTY